MNIKIDFGEIKMIRQNDKEGASLMKPKNNFFSKKCHIKRAAQFLLIFGAILFFMTSCSDILIQPVPANPSDGQNRTITINGNVSTKQDSSGAYPAVFFPQGKQSKMAAPIFSLGDAQYYVKATATGQDPREGVVNSSNNTFSISLSLGSVWTIELGAKTQEEGETAPTTKLVARYTYDHALTEADVTTTSPITLTLTPTTTETGKMNLGMPTPGTNFTSYEVTVISGPEGGATTSNFSTSTTSLVNNSIKSGKYIIQLTFKRSNGSIVYSSQEVINIFDNLTTNKWKFNGTDQSNTFILDTPMINSYALTNFYVSSSGNDTTGEGTSFKPYKTIQRAIKAINDQNSPKNYTINLLSDIQENISIKSTASTSGAPVITTSNATSLTIRGFNANRKIENNGGSTVIFVDTTVPISFENVTIKNTDAAYSQGSNCAGIVAETSTDVTLRNCTITKTKAINGSAAWTSGTMLFENCTITNNKNSDSNSIIYAGNSLTLKGCTFTNNDANLVILNTSEATLLKLDGNTTFTPKNSQQRFITISAATGAASKLTIGNRFSCSGTMLLELASYSNGLEVLIPVTTGGSTSAVASAASHFTLADGSFSIGNEGDNIGKLVLNPVVYVSAQASASGTGSVDSPYQTVAAAIEKIRTLSANSSANFIIDIDGVINEAVTLSTASSSLGTFSGSTLRLRGSDKTTDKLTGTGQTSLLLISSGLNVTIEKLTISGLESNTYASVHIESTDANVTITDCTISGNTCTNSYQSAAGGIYNEGTLALTNCTVTENNTASRGGGINNESGGNLTLTNCYITNNGNNSPANHGGGIFNDGTLSVTGGEIRGNKANYGGGISCGIDSSTEVTLENCSITNNIATQSGGGIHYTAGSLKIKGEVIVKDNKIGTGSDAPKSNIYIATGRVINIIDELDPDSRIGVTPQSAPVYNSPITLTSGLGSNSGNLTAAQKANVFTSDKSEYIITDVTVDTANELGLAVSGGTISGNATSITGSISKTSTGTTLTNGQANTITVTVTVSGMETALASGDITWAAILSSAEVEVATSGTGGDISISTGSITNGTAPATITIPANVTIFGDSTPYTLYVAATYKKGTIEKEFNASYNFTGVASTTP